MLRGLGSILELKQRPLDMGAPEEPPVFRQENLGEPLEQRPLPQINKPILQGAPSFSMSPMKQPMTFGAPLSQGQPMQRQGMIGGGLGMNRPPNRRMNNANPKASRFLSRGHLRGLGSFNPF